MQLRVARALRHVGNSKHKFRFAIGLFVDAERLCSALETLVASGLPGERLGIVVGRREVIEQLSMRLLDVAGIPRFAVVAAAERWIALKPLPAGSAGDGTADGEEPVPSPSVVDIELGFPVWALGRQEQQVRRELDLGGMALFVRYFDDDEQRFVCSTLLEHASQGVQTHEVVPPAGARA